MIIQLFAAAFFPCFLVIFFTRVTFNQLIGLVLTVALIVASVYKGYTRTWPVYIMDAASLTIGFYFANTMIQREKKKKGKQS
ncbi:protein CsbA [Weizmannia acidilactici]|uniref:Protein CsbA n=1 Tax=Weizmannia acidilactici TaxID=2607726 RepID=A0A5J4JIJ5_9BACI|nr:CsbA family protein [Weizmannia acidilactici]GER65962.1 protein CsbA [Weizmannia acidilactici]GER68824.1 protein CsbA [Weizmannia acidilactici]GER72891.1 protein CsbA [Weizmannia acidilactici]